MKKKSLLTKALLMSLLCMAIAECCFVKFAQANPYQYYEVVDPPVGSTPLAVSVSSPKNNTVYDVNDINVASVASVAIVVSAVAALSKSERRRRLHEKNCVTHTNV